MPKTLPRGNPRTLERHAKGADKPLAMNHLPLVARAQYTVQAAESLNVALTYDAELKLSRLVLTGDGTTITVHLNLARLLTLLEATARAAGQDPTAIGHETVAGNPRLQHVLDWAVA